MTRRISSLTKQHVVPVVPKRSGRTVTRRAVDAPDHLERAYSLSDVHSQSFTGHYGDQHFALSNAVSPGLVLPSAMQDIVAKLPTATTEGEFERKVRVAGGEGSFGDEASLAQGEGHWDALYAYAGGTGEATFGANGLRANGELHAGAGLVDAEGAMRIGSGAVQAELGGRAFVGAKANLYGDLTIDPSKGIYYADVGGQAFIGAKAGVNGSVNLGPVGSVAGTAEVWAGAGAQFKAKLGLENGHFKFKLDVGAALGIGFKLGGEFSLNVQPLIDAVSSVTNVVKSAGSALGSVAKSVGHFFTSLF